MAVSFVTNKKDEVQIEVISEESGVAYSGTDYFKGDKFFATPAWAAHFVSHNRARYVEAKAEAPKPTPGGKPNGDK